MNVFHDFHQTWSISRRNALNAGVLPEGYSAFVEQHAKGLIPDVLALQRRTRAKPPGLAPSRLLTPTPPATPHVIQAKEQLAARGNRIAIRQRQTEIVCAIESISPGNEGSKAASRAFVEKSIEFLRGELHLLVIDLFPPRRAIHLTFTRRSRDQLEEEPFEQPADKPLTLAAYVAGEPTAGIEITAYIEPVGVGDRMPDMPAYLERNGHVPVPLEATYLAGWDSCPADMRELVETGKLSGEDESRSVHGLLRSRQGRLPEGVASLACVRARSTKEAEVAAMSGNQKVEFTHRQGKFLAFIHLYYRLHRQGRRAGHGAVFPRDPAHSPWNDRQAGATGPGDQKARRATLGPRGHP